MIQGKNAIWLTLTSFERRSDTSCRTTGINDESLQNTVHEGRGLR